MMRPVLAAHRTGTSHAARRFRRGGHFFDYAAAALAPAMNRSPSTLLPVLGALLAAASAAAATNEITQPFEGVRLIHSRTTVPRLVDMYVVEIDMTAPGLSFLTTPSNGPLIGDTTPQTTRTFVTQVGAQLGINANFFAWAGSGPQYDVLGLSVSNGDAYSPFDPGFVDALNISADNVATIIRAIGTSGTAHQPATSLYNAVGGNTRLVTGGVNVANSDPAVHPRTAAGVTADGKLLLFTVDGRNIPHSNGLTYAEMADVLIRWGAQNAINLDGGGSTTLVMDDPATPANDPRVMNVPVGVGGVPGTERSNGNNLAVFAGPQSVPTDTVYVFADFEQGDEGTFDAALSFSGSNRGFNRDQSAAVAVSGQAFDGLWSQRLTIVNDPNADGAEQHPGGAWFARHVSGAGSPANNASRPAIGSVGFWAKTSDADLQISLVVDDASGLTGERGLAQDMIADGQWHPYFWDVTDAAQWEGWVNGDGTVDGNFTLDSIQIFGPPNVGSNLDAVVYLDAISHIVPGSLSGDFNGDWVVDAADYVLWRQGLGTTYTQGDYLVWQAHYGESANGTTGGSAPASQAAVPEPAAIALAVLSAVFSNFGRRVRTRTR